MTLSRLSLTHTDTQDLSDPAKFLQSALSLNTFQGLIMLRRGLVAQKNKIEELCLFGTLKESMESGLHVY